MNEKEVLRELLLDKGFKPQHGNSDWIQGKCVFCGDSPNPLTSHLNIRIPTDNQPMVIICFQINCVIGGYLNTDHLMKLGIDDDNIKRFVSRSSRVLNRHHLNSKEYKWQYHISFNEAYHYLSARTGLALDFNTVAQHKIILDIHVFISENNITVYEKDVAFIRDIGRNYIGFVNAKGTQVRLRQINPNIRGPKFSTLQLVNVPVHEPYAINTTDNTSTGVTNVHIGEGAFDAINASRHLAIPGSKNEYYALNTIKALMKSLNLILNRNRNVVIYFYLDADVSDTYMINVLTSSKIRYKIKNDVFFRRNIKSKDFGDIRESWELVEKQVDVHEMSKIVTAHRKAKYKSKFKSMFKRR